MKVDGRGPVEVERPRFAFGDHIGYVAYSLYFFTGKAGQEKRESSLGNRFGEQLFFAQVQIGRKRFAQYRPAADALDDGPDHGEPECTEQSQSNPTGHVSKAPEAYDEPGECHLPCQVMKREIRSQPTAEKTYDGGEGRTA